METEQDTIEQLLDYVRSRYFGKYRGTVADNNDPTGRGRLQVRVPAVLGDLKVWAMPCVPYAGDGVGFYHLPERDAGVWIEFEGGDPSFPIWSGMFWGDKQLPANEQNRMATPDLKIVRSRQGLMVTLDDNQEAIAISDKDGSNLVTIEVRQGKITVQGTVKVVVEAPQIELVEHATHPVVFGDALLQYLNQLVQVYQAHLHPGQWVGTPQTQVTPMPPQPPFPPATPQLLSTRVKSG